METKEFGNGFKTVAVLLQVVCLMIVIVTFSLILNLFERSRLSFRDIGNNYSFFHSYFYMERVTEEAMSFAKEMGSYLYYDDSDISIKGNLAHMTEISDLEFLKLFQKGRGGGLMIAVDTSLSHKDTLSKEASVYETYFPWIRIAIFAAVLAFICFLLCMIYLTLAAGRSGSDEEIRLHRIDYLPTEILFAVMIIFMTGLITFCARLSEKDWGMSSSLILTGTLVFLSDAALLALYLSVCQKDQSRYFYKMQSGGAYRAYDQSKYEKTGNCQPSKNPICDLYRGFDDSFLGSDDLQAYLGGGRTDVSVCLYGCAFSAAGGTEKENTGRDPGNRTGPAGL